MQDVHPIGGGAGGKVFGDRRLRPHHHHQPALKCPRCDSLNTKFCYFNNYNLSQPRHFCKNCRRYWTKGGVLRNVPVGGGCRKSKRSSAATKTKSSPKKPPNSHSSSEGSTTTTAVPAAVNGGGVFQNFESDNNGIGVRLEPLVGPNQVGDPELLFPSTEIGGFMSLMDNSAPESDPFHGCHGTAPFGQFLQNQVAVQDWEMRNTCGGHQEGGNTNGLVDGILDPTVRIDDLLENRGGSGGLAAVDWQATSSDQSQGLFDLPSNVDHQSYWSQTTTSQHHHQWSDSTNHDHTLFLP